MAIKVTVTAKKAETPTAAPTTAPTAAPTKAPTAAPVNPTPTTAPVKPEDKYNNVVIDNPIGEGSLTPGAPVKLTVPVDEADKSLVEWKSSDPSVAAVDSDGNVSGGQPGSATISAIINGKVIGTVTVSVSKVPVEGVTIDVSGDVVLAIAGKTQLKAIVSPANATDTSLTWSSKDETIAKVDANGVVTGVSAGKTVIEVKTKDGNKTDTINVEVKGSDDEIADGLEIDLTQNVLNDYSDKAKSEYVLLAGVDTTVRVRLVQNGQPVGNKSVKLEMEPQYGGNPNMYAIEGEKNQKFVSTDADGYAEFPISKTSAYSKLTAVDGDFESYKITASYASGNVDPVSAIVKFGCIDVNKAYVLNSDGSDGIPALNPGHNAAMTPNYYPVDYADGQEYVKSQQISSSEKDNSISIATDVSLWLPKSEAEVKTGIITEDINFKSGSYSVYNDDTNTSTTYTIKKIPAGVEYATLKFKSIELSQYSNLRIDFYELDKNDEPLPGTISTEYRYPGKIEVDALSVSVPKQYNNKNTQVVISIQSEGQVNPNTALGYTLGSLVLKYDGNSADDYAQVLIDDCVTWSVDEDYDRHQVETNMSKSLVEKYLPYADDNYDGQNDYLEEGYKYSYIAPTYPHIGEAIIIVKDSNDVDKYFFSYPVKSVDNVYYLDDYGSTKAVLISQQERDNVLKSNVSLTQTGSVVTVNSNVPGDMPLHAVIDFSRFGVDKKYSVIDAYTNVHWATDYKEEAVIEAEDFYALKGQDVKVTARLRSTTNKSVYPATKGVDLDFSLDSGDSLYNYLQYVDNFSTKTDPNGKVEFTVSNSNTSNLMSRLVAESTGYDVVFEIGGKIVECATIHWVTPGLYFKDAAETADLNVAPFIAMDNQETKVDNTKTPHLTRTTGEPWNIALDVIGQIDDTDKFVGDISGINISYDKTGDEAAQITSDGSVCSLVYDGTNDITLTGTINPEDVSDNVKFTIVDALGEVIGVYDNVGEGDTSKPIIKVVTYWSPSGLVVNIDSPLGTRLHKNTSTYVYISVTDQYGNILANRKVKYSIKGLGAISSVMDKVVYTDANGLVEIPLAAPGEVGTVEVSTAVDDTTATKKINYSDPEGVSALAITEAKVNVSDGTIKVTFNNPIIESTIDVGAFSVYDYKNSTELSISSVEKGGESNIVILTMNKADIFSDRDLSDFDIEILSYVKNNQNCQLLDTYYQVGTGVSSYLQ